MTSPIEHRAPKIYNKYSNPVYGNEDPRYLDPGFSHFHTYDEPRMNSWIKFMNNSCRFDPTFDMALWNYYHSQGLKRQEKVYTFQIMNLYVPTHKGVTDNSIGIWRNQATRYTRTNALVALGNYHLWELKSAVEFLVNIFSYPMHDKILRLRCDSYQYIDGNMVEHWSQVYTYAK